MLNFCCISCQREIQADYQLIGEAVRCPLCGFSQVVPDPPLLSGSLYHGYRIGHIQAGNLLWTTYQATGQAVNPGGRPVVIRIPTSFFLKRSSRLDDFIQAVIKSGSFNLPEFPQLVDRSVVRGKVYFVFDQLHQTHLLARCAGPDHPLGTGTALLIVRNVATALRAIWDKEEATHQNLTPYNAWVDQRWNVCITETGLSQALLADQYLLQHGFNIWDYRYISPEMRETGGVATQAVDIYALGGILHLLVSGHIPDEDLPPEGLAAAALPDPRQHNPNVPIEIVHLIHAMMARDPGDRLRSWDEVIGRIDKITPLATGQRSLAVAIQHAAAASTGEFSPTGLIPVSFLRETQRRRAIIPGSGRSLTATRPTADTVARATQFRIQDNTLPRRKSGKHLASVAARREAEIRRIIFIAVGAVAAVAFVVILLLASRPSRPRHSPTRASTPAKTGAATRPTTMEERRQPSAPATDRTRPSAPAPTFDPPPPRNPAPLSEQLAQIDAFVKDNPTAFDEGLRRYQELLSNAARRSNRTLADTVQGRINTLRKARSQHVQEVTDGLMDQAAALAAAGDRAAAIRLLRDYNGEYARESRQERIQRALKYEQGPATPEPPEEPLPASDSPTIE